MPQANSNVQPTNRDADLGGDQARSWWRTLPGMFTAAAGLISAITGLIVATAAGTATLLVGDDPTHAIALPLRLTGGSS